MLARVKPGAIGELLEEHAFFFRALFGYSDAHDRQNIALAAPWFG